MHARVILKAFKACFWFAHTVAVYPRTKCRPERFYQAGKGWYCCTAYTWISPYPHTQDMHLTIKASTNLPLFPAVRWNQSCPSNQLTVP